MSTTSSTSRPANARPDARAHSRQSRQSRRIRKQRFQAKFHAATVDCLQRHALFQQIIRIVLLLARNR
ncbi:MAG: hypothetical protein LBM04_10350 [Opitutaceae bacterium]|nr:hypothetical protein [Opitutaceae bacterium]